jgi:dipeptidase E
MLILTSSVASVAKHIHNTYLKDCGHKTILFIDTAAEPEIGHEEGDDFWLVADLKSLEDQGYEVERYTVTGKTDLEVREKINSNDIVYMCGGNTKYLLEELKKSGAFSYIKEQVKVGKPYIGTSAGSIVAGPRLPDYFYDITDTASEEVLCLNLVNFTLVPHWGSAFFASEYKNGKRLDKVYKETQEPLLLLTDSQYVYVNDDGMVTIVTTI